MRLARENPGKKIAVHNFASATNPGGDGVTRVSEIKKYRYVKQRPLGRT